MDEWINFLISQYDLDETSRESLTTLSQAENIYLLDGLKNNEEQDSNYIVNVYSHSQSEICYEKFKAQMDQHLTYQPVLVFTDWKQERALYRKIYNSSNGVGKKYFSKWFNSCSVIYTGASAPLYVNTTDGINFLEYAVHEVKAQDFYINASDEFTHPSLSGQIYNISLYQILKLYNVTGKGLFKHNVRYGLDEDKGSAVATAGEQLKFAFQQYIRLSLYKTIKSHKPSKEILEQVVEILQLSEGLMFQDGLVLPDRFWFYHNGLTIFSSEPVEINADRIVLSPKHVSVINGAQTLTKFFAAFDKLWNVELQKISVIPGFDIQLTEEMILDDIVIKTIIIQGDIKAIASITNGLNTQTPLNYDSLLGNSDDVIAINKFLKGHVKILKEGETHHTEYGYSLLDFVKNWLAINGQPGKSKNYSKQDLNDFVTDIKENLKEPEKRDEFVAKITTLEEAYKWWEETKKERKEKSEVSKDAQMISSYGKNYFGSFVIAQQREVKQEISNDFLALLYERFEKELIIIQNGKFAVNDFKKDDLYKQLTVSISAKPEQSATIVSLAFEEKEALKKMLSDEDQSAYTYAKTISHFFNSTSERLPYFRVISLVNDKAKEAFPFPNSTFNELFDEPQKSYKESLFCAEINKAYPVFVLYKDEKDFKIIENIEYIPQFSFNEYTQEAEMVYQETVAAFVAGDELLFTKTSDKKTFHIRPKAANADDTVEFTNGELITKRTFWANKETIESLIQQFLGCDDQDEMKTKNSRRSNNSFQLLGLSVGTKLCFLYDESIVVEVANNKNKVRYNEQEYTVSELAKTLLKTSRNRTEKSGVNGFLYFTKDGVSLSELRDNIEDSKRNESAQF